MCVKELFDNPHSIPRQHSRLQFRKANWADVWTARVELSIDIFSVAKTFRERRKSRAKDPDPQIISISVISRSKQQNE